VRVIYTQEMLEMEKKIKPYLAVDGLKVTLSPAAPEDIVELDRKLDSLINETFVTEQAFWDSLW